MKKFLVITFSLLMLNGFSQQLIDTTANVHIETSLFTDDYSFDFQDTDYIKKIVSFRFSSLSSTYFLVTKELEKVYNSLSLGDKEKIEEIVMARMRKSTSGLPQSLRLEDSL